MPDIAICVLGETPVGIDEVIALARGHARPRLSDDPSYVRRLRASHALLARALEAGQPVYGVTTGFGDSGDVEVPASEVRRLPLNLLRFHGCGTGTPWSREQCAAILAARLTTLARGYSGVRPELLGGLCGLLDRGVVPVIPSEGSVGASGDLTPLSYVAAVLAGEREAYHRGEVRPAAEALAAAGLAPLALEPKESLAIMNGTSAMTGLACLVHGASLRLARVAAALTAMACDVLHGVPGHFHPRVDALKPHAGQRLCARWLREDLEWQPGIQELPRPRARLQDRYSLRCAPQVIGVTIDALRMTREIIEVELNSVNDNPIVDPESDEVLFGGNFYGGHVCFAMDSLKTSVANLADLLDRQLALLCNPATSAGLPANLVGAAEPAARSHFGFKAMQISASALAAEALKLTMPASVFSRSTENHNQDKVSMGTVAARDAARIVELTETVAAIHLLALCQAVDLRAMDNCHERTKLLHAAVRRHVPMHQEDRRMDVDIQLVLGRLRGDQLPFGEARLP
jgi:histidine ammonia-lyase